MHFSKKRKKKPKKSFPKKKPKNASKKSTNQTIEKGLISVHPKGFGFVQVGEGPDVFIPKHATLDAVDGDLVEIEAYHDLSPKGPEGVVLAVLERNRSHLSAIIVGISKTHYTAYSSILGPNKILIIRSKQKLKEGDRILAKITDWNNSEHIAEGTVEKWIGSIEDPSIDMDVALLEFNIPSKFSEKVIEEAKEFQKDDVSSLDEGREDLTNLVSVTIDPDTAKDFDDAISLTKDEKGVFHLGVHIADASFFVKPGSALDEEAKKRCNSTYFPGKCTPMLPEELSNGLCSLQPDVKRLTQSVLAKFDKEGTLIEYRIVRGIIQSKKRFSYQEALEVLEGKKSSAHAALLERMVELCHLFQKKRSERGSIGFSRPENVIKVDENGKPLRLERIEYDITHQMIEEFMLKANEIVATHLSNEGKPVIYRIHEAPSEEAMRDFYTFARSLGFTLPAHPKHKDLQKLFEEAKESHLISQLSISFIRSMQLAYYFPENLGHYGLVLEYYCHFTSPIRRYSDLIVQRILFNELPEELNLNEAAQHCSKQERNSFKAESSVVLLKKMRFAKEAFIDHPEKVYTALVTKIKPFALFFEVADFDLESSFHVSEIGNDYYEYLEKQKVLRGSRSGKTFAVGHKVSVMLVRVDLVFQQTEWVLV